MSTATRFLHHRVFPFCPGTNYPSDSDFIEMTLAQAMNFYWNLENLTITTTGGPYDGAAGLDLDLNWTTQLGAVESLDPACDATRSGEGGYYEGLGSSGAAGKAPRGRVCNGAPPYLINFSASELPGANRINYAAFQLMFYTSPTPGNVRLYYWFQFASAEGPMIPGVWTAVLDVLNPASAVAVSLGTPPASGTFIILGHTFNWVGGLHGISTWSSAQGCSISATSSAFTYAEALNFNDSSNSQNVPLL